MTELAPPEQRPVTGIMLRIAAATVFSLMAAMVKIGSDYGLHTIEMIFWRFAFALPPILVWIALRPGFSIIKTKRPRAHLWRALIGLVAMGCSYYSITLLPLAEATTISFAAPVFATLLSAVFLMETVGWHRWGAVVAGFVGVLVVMQPQNATLPLNGLIVALVAAFGVACVIVTIRQISKTERAMTTVFWFTLIAALVTGFIVPFYGTNHDWLGWAIMFAIAVLGGTAQLLLTASLRVAPVVVVAPFDYIQLLWAVGLGWLIWSDVPTIMTGCGAAIIIASGLYTLFRERRRSKQPVRPVIV
ncbi:DMT family transporter [Parasphingopyxis lamellibrachiae]|uniref:Drug/metabolite transporter (DMT)-like permease n=1 Tax=Parasphingopyxis lamellibrachiae TaxID=680125 RepID=A0A3D9FDP6_9SPHN|nr:DMT family transporter [Parasphingopyxis lamellibrachiae]RED15692.1 drug/metabolite transporter (DMT)-like permease [Parasphingopyxis lamellibrachiae]